MTRLRTLRCCTVCLTLFALACADLKAVFALATDIQRQYHVMPTVNIANETQLTITFPQSALAELKGDSGGTKAFAREVAEFAMAHYSKASELTNIEVEATDVTESGALTTTRRTMEYTFPVSELSGKKPAPPAP